MARRDAVVAGVAAAALLATLLAWSTGTKDGPTALVVPEGASLGGLGGLAWRGLDQSWWTVTDRGDGSDAWPIRLAALRVEAGSLRVERTLTLTDDGDALTGDDLDPQGIAAGADGSFWIVDEKDAKILRFDDSGRLMETRDLPSSWSGHAKNRGPEGLALTPDGSRMFAILQAGLPQDAPAGRTRIAVLDLATGAARELAYQMGDPAAPGDDDGKLRATGLEALGDGRLLVLEHGGGARPSWARVYAVDPAPYASTPLAKTLHLDARAAGYETRKPSGLAVNEAGALAIMHDNDLDGPSVLWILPP